MVGQPQWLRYVDASQEALFVVTESATKSSLMFEGLGCDGANEVTCFADTHCTGCDEAHHAVAKSTTEIT